MLPSLTCSDEDLAFFWKSQMGSPQMTPELKALIREGRRSQLPIPWLLHGDGAPFTEVDSLVVLSTFGEWSKVYIRDFVSTAHIFSS